MHEKFTTAIITRLIWLVTAARICLQMRYTQVKVARATILSTTQPRPNALSVIVSLMQWADLARLGPGSWEDGHAIAEPV